MLAKIVGLLRGREGFFTEEELTSLLRINPEELWDYIRRLRDAGYGIDSAPHSGYKLVSTPARISPADIESGFGPGDIGHRVVCLQSTGSTMDEALKLADQGVEEGTLVVAESQTNGRGRSGRSWFSPEGKGLYFSFILRPKAPQGKLALLNLLAAVGVSEAVRNITGIAVQIKWPNDILLNGRKVGGILTEAGTKNPGSAFVVVGVGLNVNAEAEDVFPGAAALKEGSLVDIDRTVLLKEILRRIHFYYGEFNRARYSAIIDKWRGLNSTLGQRVRVKLPKGLIEGEALEIEDDGGLLLRRDSGLVEKIMVGDVIYCRRYQNES